MTVINLRRVDKGGTIRVWEAPRDGEEYVIGADVAQGATFGEAREDRDSSTICILRREPTRLVQVAEAVSMLSTYDFGKLVAAFGVWYNFAWVNVERNLAHGVIAGLEAAGYPTDRWYQPPVQTSVSTHHSGQYFTYKTQNTSRMLMDLLADYMNPDGGQLVLKSKALVDELSALQKDRNGRVETNGRDLTIALCMALVIDRDVDPVSVFDAARHTVNPERVPFGMDPELWLDRNKPKRIGNETQDDSPEIIGGEGTDWVDAEIVDGGPTDLDFLS